MGKTVFSLRCTAYFIALIFGLLFSINSINADSSIYVGKGKQPDDPAGPSRTPPFIPLSVTLTDDYNLNFVFIDNVGITTITILDNNDTVIYNAVVDSGAQPFYEVSLETFDSGQYHLQIRYATTELHGEFTL